MSNRRRRAKRQYQREKAAKIAPPPFELPHEMVLALVRHGWLKESEIRDQQAINGAITAALTYTVGIAQARRPAENEKLLVINLRQADAALLFASGLAPSPRAAALSDTILKLASIGLQGIQASKHNS